MQSKIFFIVEAIAIDLYTWMVRGRACEDIHLGDTVSVVLSTTELSETEPKLIVQRISTYGHEVDELNQMLTGDLVLRSEVHCTLTNDTFLVRSTQTDATEPNKLDT